jgi:hypothetical protein
MLLHVTRLPHLDQPSLDVKETVNKILKTELETETLMKFFNIFLPCHQKRETDRQGRMLGS